MELHLERSLLLADELRSAVVAALAAMRPRIEPSRITVPRMSASWLHEHAADSSKHADER